MVYLNILRDQIQGRSEVLKKARLLEKSWEEEGFPLESLPEMSTLFLLSWEPRLLPITAWEALVKEVIRRERTQEIDPALVHSFTGWHMLSSLIALSACSSAREVEFFISAFLRYAQSRHDFNVYDLPDSINITEINTKFLIEKIEASSVSFQTDTFNLLFEFLIFTAATKEDWQALLDFFIKYDCVEILTAGIEKRPHYSPELTEALLENLDAFLVATDNMPTLDDTWLVMFLEQHPQHTDLIVNKLVECKAGNLASYLVFGGFCKEGRLAAYDHTLKNLILDHAPVHALETFDVGSLTDVELGKLAQRLLEGFVADFDILDDVCLTLNVRNAL